MFWLYNLLILLLLPLAAGYLGFQWLVKKRYRESLRERFGSLRPLPFAPESGEPAFWIHAVSVGEVVAVTPLVKALRQAYPASRLLVSTVTETGQAAARRNLPEADALIYFPLDLPWIVRKFIRRVRPSLFVFVETEIWPNFLWSLARMGIPAMMVNGRISSHSLRGYKWFSFFFRRVLRGVVLFSVRTETDRARLVELGLDPRRVVTTGNMKYDQAVKEVSVSARQLRSGLRLPEQARLFIAGSTHDGEEGTLVDCYKRLSAAFPRIRLLIAPRHIERVEKVERLLEDNGLRAVRKTKLESCGSWILPSDTVILLDTLGELQQLYSAADLVFVGGSLVPIGGHNVMEPAACSRPVLFGPHMDNFADIAALLVDRGAARMVADGRDLCSQTGLLIEDPARADEMGRRGREVILEQQGAVHRNLELIQKVMSRING